jgi:hypothetical protein
MRTRLSKVSIQVDICVYLSGLVKSSESQQVVRIRNRRGHDTIVGVGGVILDSDYLYASLMALKKSRRKFDSNVLDILEDLKA